MRRTKTNYPVGATWQVTDNRGMTTTIWLESREKTFEVWRWKRAWQDGSLEIGLRGSDWNTSYALCRRDANPHNKDGSTPRLKRIK